MTEQIPPAVVDFLTQMRALIDNTLTQAAEVMSHPREVFDTLSLTDRVDVVVGPATASATASVPTPRIITVDPEVVSSTWNWVKPAAGVVAAGLLDGPLGDLGNYTFEQLMHLLGLVVDAIQRW